MPGLTLRQVEIIRAVMLTGSINGAAEFLNISSPGISRLVKHAEESLGVRLFERKRGVFLPAPEARAVFEQINEVYGKIEGLETAIARLNSGDVRGAGVRVGAVGSAVHRGPRDGGGAPAVPGPLHRSQRAEDRGDGGLPDAGAGRAGGDELCLRPPVAGIRRAGRGELVAVVPDGHPLAERASVSVRELAGEPLIGVSPDDPYGSILATPFREAGLEYRLSIRARFAQTVVSLVRHGLGVAVIDEFSVAGVYMPGLSRIRLEETTAISIHAVQKQGRSLSGYADFVRDRLRDELRKAVRSRPWESR